MQAQQDVRARRADPVVQRLRQQHHQRQQRHLQRRERRYQRRYQRRLERLQQRLRQAPAWDEGGFLVQRFRARQAERLDLHWRGFQLAAERAADTYEGPGAAHADSSPSESPAAEAVQTVGAPWAPVVGHADAMFARGARAADTAFRWLRVDNHGLPEVRPLPVMTRGGRLWALDVPWDPDNARFVARGPVYSVTWGYDLAELKLVIPTGILHFEVEVLEVHELPEVGESPHTQPHGRYGRDAPQPAPPTSPENEPSGIGSESEPEQTEPAGTAPRAIVPAPVGTTRDSPAAAAAADAGTVRAEPLPAAAARFVELVRWDPHAAHVPTPAEFFDHWWSLRPS